MSFPRYPRYKDSGVEWLGEVPEHWEVKPVRTVAALVNGYPFDAKLFTTHHGFPLVRIRDLGRTNAEVNYAGEFVERAAIDSTDVLIGMDGEFNVGRWRGTGRALLNQRMCCVRATSDAITRFLEYALPIPLRAINDVTYSTTVKHLSSFQVEKIRIALPPSTSELGQLLGFLDRETVRIANLVAEQQRLMQLLKEKRQAVISHAVTRGLDPDAPMKPSGVEWLGDVPTHWEVTRLANILREVAEPGRDELPVLTVSIHDGVSDRELNENELDTLASGYKSKSCNWLHVDSSGFCDFAAENACESSTF